METRSFEGDYLASKMPKHATSPLRNTAGEGDRLFIQALRGNDGGRTSISFRTSRR